MRKLIVLAALAFAACAPVPVEEFTLPQDKEQCAKQPDLPWCE